MTQVIEYLEREDFNNLKKKIRTAPRTETRNGRLWEILELHIGNTVFQALTEIENKIEEKIK